MVRGSTPASGTDIVSPQPRCSPKNHGFSARSRAVVRSRSICATDSGDSRPSPSAASMAANAARSSAVETSPPAPSGSAGGAAYQPSGRSMSTRPALSASSALAPNTSAAAAGAYMLVNRPSLAAGTWNAVSVMPSGSKTRLPSTSASDAPVTRSMRIPATVAPVLYRQTSPGWSSSGRLPSPAIHWSGGGGVGGHGGPSVLRPSSASAPMAGRGAGGG